MSPPEDRDSADRPAVMSSSPSDRFAASGAAGSNPFAGSGAVVTGASSGIGRAIALSLASAGAARMLIHYRRNRDGAEQTAREAEALGCQTSVFGGDLADPDLPAEMARVCFERLGTIQTWVNNAGADVLTGEASGLSFEEKLGLLLAVDVQGTIALSRQVARRLVAQVSMLAGKEGTLPPSITFIGWDQAIGGMEGDAGQMFAPVKSAVMSFAASLAQSVAPHVRVNTVAPGWIRTSWGESTDDYWDRRARRQSLMGRWGRPEDVAGAVLRMADPSQSFLTGQTIEVNGGWNRRFER